MLKIEKVTPREVALFDNEGVRRSKTYTAISSPKWQFRIARNEALFGILKCIGNDVREIVVPCSNSIPDIRDLVEYGMTVLDLNDGMALITAGGRKLLNMQKEIYIVNEKLVAVRDVESANYRLFNPQTGRMTVKSYSDFELYDEYIQTFDGNLMGVLNWNLQEELPAEYIDAYPWGNVFKGITETGKEVLGSAKWGKTSAECTKFFPESHGFFRAFGSKAKRYGFISAEDGKTVVPFIYYTATDYSRSQIAQVEKEPGVWKILDKFGKIVEEDHIT